LLAQEASLVLHKTATFCPANGVVDTNSDREEALRLKKANSVPEYSQADEALGREYYALIMDI
jgi:hypothetical protein